LFSEECPKEGIDPQIAKQLATASKTVAISTSELIRSSINAETSQPNTKQAEQLSRSTQSVTEAIQGMCSVLCVYIYNY
jgi:hypothetical protein